MFRNIRELLTKLLKIANILMKIVPTFLDVLEDLSDDGKRNNSNKQ